MKLNNNLTLALCVTFGLTACSPSLTVEEHIAEAKGYSENSDYNSAIIALKNAAKLNANDANIRFMLGATYLAQGDYYSAEKELEKAESLGSDNPLLVVKLVEAKLKANKFDYVYQIAEKSTEYPSGDQVIILTYAGIASIHQNKLDQAREYIEQAISISDDSVYGNIGKAYLAYSGSNYERGLSTVNELLDTAPEFAEAVLLKGYLLQSSKKFEEAVKAFEHYAQLRPNDIQVRFFIAQNYVFAQNFAAAEKPVDILLKISKLHPLANQLKAEIEYSKGNYKQAKDHAEVSFQQNSASPIAKIIAGISAYKLGDFEQSYQYLMSVKDIVPPENLVRKLIVDLQLKLGYDVAAVNELQSLSELNFVDSEMLTMASNEMLVSGNFEAAQDLLKSSIALETTKPEEIAKQGFIQLRLNQVDQGIERLEQALQLDPDLAFAEQGLVMGYLANEQFSKALNIAKKWQLVEDKRIQGFLLEANVFQQQNKNSEAKFLFNKVLELDSDNVAALYKLATFSHTEGDEQQAFKYYTQVLKQQPDHVRSIVNFNRLVAFSITKDKNLINKAINFFQQELEKNKSNNYLKMNLAYTYRLNKNYAEAINLFTEIEQSENPLSGVAIALGDTYKALGQLKDAENIYQKIVDNEPQNLKAARKLLVFFEEQNQFEKALVQIENILRVNQNNTGFILLKTYYQSLLRITPKEGDLAKIKNNDKIAAHWIFDKTRGNLAYTLKDFDSSTKYYESAYKKESNEINAINWSKSVALAGDKNKSVVILEQYLSGLEGNEISVSLQVMLGGAYLNSERLVEAVTMYEGALLQEANNVIVLNNLSYLELQRGNVEKSILYAKTAVELAEGNAGIIDTYAQVLVANKQFSLAIEQYDKALKISNNNPEIAKHKAKAIELKSAQE